MLTIAARGVSGIPENGAFTNFNGETAGVEVALQGAWAKGIRTTLSYSYQPKDAGSVKITAKITNVEGAQSTTSNDLQLKYITVLKNTFKIVLFAGAPSSDVSFIKDHFSSRKEVELVTFIQKQGAEFYEGAPTYEKVRGADLVVLVGFPIASSTSAVRLPRWPGNIWTLDHRPSATRVASRSESWLGSVRGITRCRLPAGRARPRLRVATR